MKTRPICLSIAVAILGIMNLQAEDFRTDINPALLYYRALLLGGEVTKEDSEYISKEWRGERLPADFGERITRTSQLKLFRQAGRQKPRCDWGIDFSPGPETLLPHFTPLKRMAVRARLHAMWSLQCGEQDEAKEDLVAIAALARNLSTDGSMVSVQLQCSLESMACSTIAENYFQLAPETLQKIVEGFDAAPPRGTMADACLNEQTYFSSWFQDKVRAWQKQYAGDEGKVQQELTNLLSEIGQYDGVWSAAGGTSEGFIKLCHEVAELYPPAVEILRLPEPAYDQKVKDFNARIEKLNNPMAALVPAVFKGRNKELAVLANLAMVRAAAEYKLHGEDGFKRVADPLGDGPFVFERFVYQGLDRGFKLTSAFKGFDYPVCLIFVEKDGPAFKVLGPNAGKAVDK